ncbi:MAG: sulfurtransferase [Alphaproteobacteria bacterium]|nr:sulfurtransferase [Alphaproteobacteria bacterium]
MSELEIDVAALAAMNGNKPLLLDVRESWETEICALPGSLFIPMSQIEARLGEIPRDRPVLAVCHHGGRSLRVAQWLRGQGFAGVQSLRGGVHQWAEQIDPKMAKY